MGVGAGEIGRGRRGRERGERREVRKTGTISALHLRVLPGLEAAEGLGSSPRPGAAPEITLAIIRAAHRHLEEERSGRARRRAAAPAVCLRSTGT